MTLPPPNPKPAPPPEAPAQPAAAPAAGARAPGPPGSLLLGNLKAMRDAPLALLMDSFREFGDVVRLRFGGMTVHLLAHPDHISHVLRENHRAYSKQTRGFQRIAVLLGQGLLTSEGEFWRRQRRIAQPAFHHERIAGYAAAMAGAAADLAVKWEAPARAGETVDVAAEMSRLAQRIVGETLLGTDVSGAVATVGHALSVLQQQSRREIYRLIPMPERLPTPARRRTREARRMLDDVIYGIIARRRREGGDRGDLLSMLLLARDEETGEGMSDTQLRDEVMTMFIAGHETTANALTWTFYLLSLHPQSARRLHAELRAVLGGRPPGFADLERLEQTNLILREAMRLRPPAWVISRRAIAADSVGGYAIPAGSVVLVSPWVTHRHPALWENPEGFDPDRFAPELHQQRHRFAYFPFGGGPRKCIGEAFALTEARIVLATLAQRYRLELLPGQSVEPHPTIILRPQGGLKMRIVAHQPNP